MKIFVLTMLLMFAGSVFGQTASSMLEGTVFDANGAVIPGASVSAMDENGKVISAMTNYRGDYELNLTVKAYEASHNFKISKYQISAVAAGFEKTIISNFKIVSGSMRLDLGLDVMISTHDHDMILPSPIVEKPEPQLPKRPAFNSRLNLVPIIDELK